MNEMDLPPEVKWVLTLGGLFMFQQGVAAATNSWVTAFFITMGLVLWYAGNILAHLQGEHKLGKNNAPKELRRVEVKVDRILFETLTLILMSDGTVRYEAEDSNAKT